MKKAKLLIAALAFLASATFALAQNKAVSGIVKDASSGEGVPFASIQVKGTMTGFNTDDAGRFNIEVPSNAVLIFSSIGYKNAEEAVNGRSVVNVSLTPDAESLEETIVVAYGVQKKSSFVGSATQLSGDKIQKMQSTNISKSLEGAVAGLQTASSSGTPGSGAAIQIRGFGSVSASTSPLIVVDGVPYEGSLNSIPNQDIESLTVLKDAAANSMYGARGSNGVIIITTKRGAAGKVNITFDAKMGINSRGVPSYDVISNPSEYYEMSWEAIRNAAYYNGQMPNFAQAGVYASNALLSEYLGPYNIYKNVADNEIIDPTTGKINPNAVTRKWNDDWNKDVFKAGVRQEYNVSASGGSEKTRAYMSVSYLNDQGYVPNSGFTRISVRGKVDQNIGKYITAGVNLAYSNTAQKKYADSEDDNYANLFMFSQSIAPIYPIYLYDKDGNRVKDYKGNDMFDWGETGRAYAPTSNPYGQLMSSLNNDINDNMSSRGYININILPELVLSVNAAYDVFNTKSVVYQTPVGGDAANVGGRAYHEMDRYTALNANQLLTWTPTFGHNSLNLLLGHETKSDSSYFLKGHMTNFVDKDIPDFANATVYQDLTSASSSYFLEGFFGRAEYDYANKYYASVSYRRDGSSRFAPDKRWGSFWSIGASWNAKNELFLNSIDWLNALRVKLSYGTQGNDNIGYTRVYENLYRIDRVDGAASLTQTFRAAPDVTWEKSNNFNIGFETKIFDRVSMNMEYFVKETKDMIYSRPLASSQGSPDSQLVNDMDMMNKGVEFEISADIFKNRNFAWNLSLNGTHYKNAITKLPSDYPDEGKQISYYWRELGGSLYNYYLFEWAGVNPENGLPQYNKYVTDENGKETVEIVNSTSEASYRKTGKTPIPDLYGGFTTSFRLYNFDLSASFAYQIGGYTLDSVYQRLMSAGGSGDNWSKDIFNRWTPENRNTDVPRVQMNDQEANSMSTRFLTSSSYFSVRNITLGYNVPSQLLKKVSLSGLRIYLTGDNLFYTSARRGMDVRKSFSGGNGQTYSALRTVSAGVTVTF
ncbi:MAG: TonB-dependent receptor [Bacteroidales bacterium]|nr:TonB-dependent receptor [Bacteroidales bacterium]